jgi:arginine deiminase
METVTSDFNSSPALDADSIPIPLNISSEYAPLQAVLVHHPGSEVDRLTPDNRESLLFEDIPYLPRMQEEHLEFVGAMREEGVRVLLLGDLLLDILTRGAVRKRLVTGACGFSSMPSLANIILDTYCPEEIRDLLFSGLTDKELDDRIGRKLGPSNENEEFFLLHPIPNAYFSRDPAAAVCGQLVSCKMHFPARIRESVIVREIFRSHPLFAGTRFIYGNGRTEDRPFTLEGGDIIVINGQSIAVGSSQRTRSESIVKLATRLFEEGLAERVYEVNIPADRAYMHLDTVFTIIDEGLVVAYPDVIDKVTEIRRYEAMIVPDNGGDKVIAYPVDENRGFKAILEREFNRRLKVITTGNKISKYAAREQRADGTNVFALKPSTVITYDRNTHTNEALRAEGVRVIEVAGSELVRGLGGPRCMTMPLARADSEAEGATSRRGRPTVD